MSLESLPESHEVDGDQRQWRWANADTGANAPPVRQTPLLSSGFCSVPGGLAAGLVGPIVGQAPRRVPTTTRDGLLIRRETLANLYAGSRERSQRREREKGPNAYSCCSSINPERLSRQMDQIDTARIAEASSDTVTDSSNSIRATHLASAFIANSTAVSAKHGFLQGYWGGVLEEIG
jgi:hypothetical protein